jgi:hypothetical protein
MGLLAEASPVRDYAPQHVQATLEQGLLSIGGVGPLDAVDQVFVAACRPIAPPAGILW